MNNLESYTSRGLLHLQQIITYLLLICCLVTKNDVFHVICDFGNLKTTVILLATDLIQCT